MTLHESLRAAVEAKRAALEGFLADLDARIRRGQNLLTGHGNPHEQETARGSTAVE
ncbi:MAG TPA: hypothetical protein VH307_12920 [Streptosporangiaceae bacterium]|nr:hypothetical protein [Streptosporangiaceae bacterium]